MFSKELCAHSLMNTHAEHDYVVLTIFYVFLYFINTYADFILTNDITS